MKWVAVAAMLAGSLGVVGHADAKGCIRGALVGGVAGHYAGHHGLLGAAAGCVAGRHYYANKARQQQEAPADTSAPPPAPAQ